MRSECEDAHEDNSSATRIKPTELQHPVPEHAAMPPLVSIPFHRGRNRFSSHPKPKSADKRQNRGGNRPGQNELIVHHGETAKNELAQASGANRGGDGGQSHGNNDRHAHAGEDHAHRQRQLDLKQKLAVGESHAAPGLDHGRIDAADAGVGVANHGQQRVESQRQNRQAIGTIAEPGHRQQKSKERETRDRLNNVRGSQHRLVPNRPVRTHYAQRNTDQHREQRGDSHQPEMLQREFQNLFVILQQGSERGS